MFVKTINVRGLEPQVLAEMQALAQQNERSLEAEARLAIRQWCQLQQKQSSSQLEKYNQALSARLQIVLDMANQISHNKLSYSHIAEKFGHNDPSQVQTWFTGEAVPSFNETEHLSFLLGCDANWLKHGTNSPYRRYFYDITKQSPLFFAKDVINTTLDGLPVYKLHIVLNENNGYIYCIQEFEQNHLCYTYLSSSFYLKGEYGSSGLANTARFILMLLALDHLNSKVIIKGYTIEDKFAQSIFGKGEKHPLLFRAYSKESPWNEDIIDKNYPMSYWEGYKSLQQKVHQYIDNDELLTKYKKEILSSYD